MRLQKTDLAKKELLPGVRTLGQRERSVLLLADGLNTSTYLSSLFHGEGHSLVLQLVQAGYLAEVTSLGARSPKSTGQRGAPGPEVNRTAVPTSDSIPSAVLSVDQFEGKRSLATTRMFLFDISERMFSRRSPEQAAFFRASLRDSRDRASMLAAGQDMLLEIEKIAGYERADSIRERIAMLLPPEEMLL
jgi:hypothetical protein